MFATFLLCVAVILAITGACSWVIYKLAEKLQAAEVSKNNYVLQLQEEIQHLKKANAAIIDTLNDCAGGISKRLNESVEIGLAIAQIAPSALRTNKCLVYCLHANDQFLLKLHSLAEHQLDSRHRREVKNRLNGGRDRVFNQLYELAGALRPEHV